MTLFGEGIKESEEKFKKLPGKLKKLIKDNNELFVHIFDYLRGSRTLEEALIVAV